MTNVKVIELTLFKVQKAALPVIVIYVNIYSVCNLISEI